MLNFGCFLSLRGAKRRSNLDFRAFEIATAFEKGLAMTQRGDLYPRTVTKLLLTDSGGLGGIKQITLPCAKQKAECSLTLRSGMSGFAKIC